jgi:hypothetical protein
MNERLQKLAEHANLCFYDNGELIVVRGNIKVFAELIVRECANRASWAQDTGEADIGGEVLKHFGVEE